MTKDSLNSDIERSIVSDYEPGVTSLRFIGRKYGLHHKTIKNILEKNNVRILTDLENRYYNVVHMLRFNVSYKEMLKYDDVDKLLILNRMVQNNNRRYDFDRDTYFKYLDKFYYCERFNKLYNLWLENGKETLRKPSIDHIIPTSKGGDRLCVENMQVMTWFANRAKGNCMPDEWDSIISCIDEYLI